jgi:hypothetical protein
MDESEEQGNVVSGNKMLLLVAWLWVGIPLALGVADTLNNATKLFK